GVFRQRLETEPARVVDRRFPDRADCARNHRHAVPARVSAAIEIKAAGVFERLAARDERAEVADLRVPRDGADSFIGKWLDQTAERIALAMRIGIEKNDDTIPHRGETALQRARFPAIHLT